MSITSAACGRRSFRVSRCCQALESPEFWWTYEAKNKKQERSTTSHYVSENSFVRLFTNARRRVITITYHKINNKHSSKRMLSLMMRLFSYYFQYFAYQLSGLGKSLLPFIISYALSAKL
jgi:hypothetical protein